VDTTSFRVSVWTRSREERDLATSILSRTEPDEVHVYDGSVTGVANDDLVRELLAAGLMVDRSSGTPDNPPPQVVPGLEQALGALFADAPILDTLLQRAAELPLVPASFWRRLLARALAWLPLERLFGALGGFSAFRGIGAGGMRWTARLEPSRIFEVQLMGPMRPLWSDLLRAQGIRITSYVPPYRYRMALTDGQEKALRAQEWVASIKPYDLRDTVTPEFVSHLQEQERNPSSEPTPFDVTLHAPEQAAAILETIRRSGQGTVDAASGRFIRLRAPALSPLVAALADRTEVKSITPYRPPALFCDFGRPLIGVPAASAAPGGPWDGTGEVIGLIDSGVDAGHADLQGRVKHDETVPGATQEDLYGHGTHVAGILCGTGAASGGRIQGVAPGAQLAVVGIVDPQFTPLLPPDMGTLLQLAVDQDARIVNLSLGFPENRYNPYAESVDEFVLGHPDVLVVVAAGNRGTATETRGVPDLNTLASPATAKNALAVGACVTDRPGVSTTWKQYNAASFGDPLLGEALMAGPPILPAALSSRGPTDSFSIKPDLVAPGTYILSAKAAKGALASYAPVPPGTGPYIYLNGTSMAAPFVAGAAAILRQYLRKAMSVDDPSAALLKALLCGSAVRGAPIRSPAAVPQVGYPDFDQGAGRLDLSAILPEKDAQGLRLSFVDVANGSPEALQGHVPPGSPRRANRRYKLTVASGGSPLRAVLTWTDTPGVGLQNVLKFALDGPGVKLIGNHEHTFAPSPLGTPFDYKNNVQVVNVAAASAGEYTLSVLADNTPFPDRFQGYALVVLGRLAGPITEEAPAF